MRATDTWRTFLEYEEPEWEHSGTELMCRVAFPETV